MRVLLINPPFQRLKGVKISYFPLGLGYLAAVIAERGNEVKIYNAENPSKGECTGLKSVSFLMDSHSAYMRALKDEEHIVWQKIGQVIKDFQPDIVGLSVMTAKYASALMITNICKKIKSDTVVVWGGPHPTVQPAEVLENGNVDFVVRGEGEETITALIEAISEGNMDFAKIDGISYREGDKLIHNKPRSLMQDLDSIPFPAGHLSLKGELYSSKDLSMLVTSRGCPFQCAYCGASSIWGRRVRSRSVENVIEEIKTLMKEYGYLEFYFVDDTFTINRSRVIEICQALRREKLDVTWRCATRVDLIDMDLLREMKRAGCSGIHIGIETGSVKMLEYIRKGTTLEQVREAAHMLRKIRLDWMAYFMVGFPEETREDINETIALMRELDPPAVVLGIFTPYPGTELYENVVKLGLLPENPDWSLYDHQSPANYFVKGMEREEYDRIVQEFSALVDRLNNRPSALLRRGLGRLHFYWKHPLGFLKIVYTYIKRRI